MYLKNIQVYQNAYFFVYYFLLETCQIIKKTDAYNQSFSQILRYEKYKRVYVICKKCYVTIWIIDVSFF